MVDVVAAAAAVGLVDCYIIFHCCESRHLLDGTCTMMSDEADLRLRSSAKRLMRPCQLSG